MSERAKARQALLELSNAFPRDHQFAEAERRIEDTQFEDMGPDNYVRIGKLRAIREQARKLEGQVEKIYEEFCR